MERLYILEKWNEFTLKSACPQDPEIREILQMVFFMGANSFSEILVNMANDSKDQRTATLSSLNSELDAFRHKMMKVFLSK